MNVKCPLSIAVIGLALTSSAFSWKSKPTAELKADFVRFAREAGHGAFADKIASEGDLVTWMDEGLRYGESLLAACEGAAADDPRRRTALLFLDYPFHVDNYRPSTPPAEREAFERAVFGYARRAYERVLREVKEATVGDGQLRAWHVYNMAYVFKGPRHVVLVDFTPRPVTPVERTPWTDAAWRAFAEIGDLLVITHPHRDHTSFPLMARMRERGKPLVLPCAMRDPATSNVYAAATGVYVLDRDHAEPIDVAGVRIWNFLGNQGKDVPCNVYLMDIDGVRVADNGDNRDCGKYAGLKGCPPADLIVASTWNRVTDFVGGCRAAPGFNLKTAVFLPSHENELSHGVDHRESYLEMYTDPKRLAAPGFVWPTVKPLGWGESVTVSAANEQT